MDDKIQVGVRVRPLLEREASKSTNWVVSGNSISQKDPLSGSLMGSPYPFDHVFDKNVPTDVIYTTLAVPIIHSVMEGFNGTIFAYGQTSSGKTHTMTGNRMHPGIIPLTFDQLFTYIDKHPKREFIIAVTYMELYNEKLTDLLNPGNRTLSIQEADKHKVFVRGLTEVPVTTVEEIGHLLVTGQNNRSIGETAMNEQSSRSHTVFAITVESRCREGEGDDAGTVKIATLNLVDLAGSERAAATGAEGIRFKEGTCINKSLLQLGIVISKLTEGSSAHIPFRDSKLTRILQSSLGGNTKTCIICAITPAEVTETVSTLKFASRAMKVQNKPIVNEVLVGEEAYKRKLKMYEEENEALRRKLEKGLPEQEKQQLTQQLEQSEKQKVHLEERILSLKNIIVKSSANIPDSITKAQRRRTMCAAFPSQGVISATMPKPLSATMPRPLSALMQATPVAKRRVTFASSPFTTHFDHNSFIDHLNLQDISPVEDRRRTRLIGRPSFIPRSSDYLDDTEESSIQQVDAQVQTDDPLAAHSSIATQDAECQTDTVASPAEDVESMQSLMTSTKQHTPVVVSAECQTDLDLSKPSVDVQQGGAPSGVPVQQSRVEAMTQTRLVSIQHVSDASFCVHCHETRGPKGAVHQMETMQFEFDEVQQSLDEVEQLLAVKEAEVREAAVRRDIMVKKVGDLEMANQAQEELLMTLQARLKEKNIKLQQVNQQLQQALQESEEKAAAQQVAATELTEMREQLLALQQKLQKTTQPLPKDSAAVDDQLKSKTAELTAKLAEAERMRKEDDFRFQKSYEQMALQTRKACERACALEEMVETMEQQAGSEEVRMRASLDEKSQLIETLREQCTTTKLQLELLSTEYEEYVAKMAGTVRHLQQQVVSSELDSAAVDDQLKSKTAELTAKLAEAERMRKEDDLRFQRSYEQMALDVKKASERACALEEQIATREQQAGSNEAEMRASLDEKLQLIETLREQCTTTELQLQSLSAKYEEHVGSLEGTVRHLQQKFAASEQDSTAVDDQLKVKTTELTAKLAEAERMRKEDASRFQKSYEQMALDVQKAREQASALEQQQQQAGSDEVEMRASLDEKSQLIETLREQCTATKKQHLSVTREYEEYVSRMEGTVRHLQQQLATSEQDSTAVDDQLKVKTTELTAKLAEAERMRKEDDLRFQKSYEQMALDVQKAREQATALEQQQQQAGSDEAEMRASLDEKSQLIETLREQCTSTKKQHLSVTREYEEYVSRTEGTVRHLQQQLATSEQDSAAVNSELKTKTAELTTKLTEAERMRKEDDLRFQKNYEHMALDFQKASERACALEEQIATREQQAGSEEAKMRASLDEKSQLIETLREQADTMRASLGENTQLIESLRQQCTSTKEQFQSLSTEYEQYASRMDWRVRHLQQQLAASEQDSAAVDDQLKVKTAELTAKLAEVERMRKEDDLRFQKSYEQMELDVQKARQRECTLEQQLMKMESENKSSLAAETAELQLREVRKENARLRTKIQCQAVWPSESTSLVTDGSGFVTGVALHQMRQEKQMLARQNDQLKSRVQKLKDEFIAEREKLNGAREELKRYRDQRNIFRAKYQGLKADCKCGAVNSDQQDDMNSNPAPPQSTSSALSQPSSIFAKPSRAFAQPSSAFSQPSTNSIALEKLPSPKAPRRSILSFNPDRDLQPERRRPFTSADPLADPIIPKPVAIRKEEAVVSSEPENVVPLEPRRVRGNREFIWEQTLLEGSEEVETEPQDCKQQ